MKIDIKKIRALIIALILIASIVLNCILAVFAMNVYVINFSGRHIITPEEAEKLSDVDCIIVLGCLVEENGEPSDRLADRVYGGVDLYKRGVAPKIIMSGDHGREDYDEVGAMKRTAIECGVPSSDIFMDHEGFSTYESIYRAKEMFGAERIVIVTQEYHLYRAIYIAESLGVEAYGVSTDYRPYEGHIRRNVREVFARCKDIAMTIFKPEASKIDEKISLDSDGDITNNYIFK